MAGCVVTGTWKEVTSAGASLYYWFGEGQTPRAERAWTPSREGETAMVRWGVHSQLNETSRAPFLRHVYVSS